MIIIEQIENGERERRYTYEETDIPIEKLEYEVNQND